MKIQFTKKTRKIVMISLISVILIAFIAAGMYYIYIRNSIYKALDKPKNQIKVEEGKEDKIEYEEQEGITNILLIGVDARNINEKCRSDSIIIATIDDTNKKVKLTSIMRDSYVKIQGHNEQKINAAYAFGGPELLMDTIERNFKIKLDKYVIINFWGFQDLVDAIGGIDINVKDYEISEINKFIGEVNDVKSPPLTHPGLQHLDGQQALSYSRIRHVGDGSYERTKRQREVLTVMLDKLKETKITQYHSLLTKMLPYIKTNIEPISLLNYAYTVSKFKPLQVDQLQIPMTELSDGRIYNGAWVLLMDKEQNSKVLRDFIFRDKTTKKEELDLASFKSIIKDYLNEEIKKTPDINHDDPKLKVEPKDSNYGGR